AGLDRPDDGDIWVHGRHVYSASARLFVNPEHRDLGMVFQSYALWPHMTVTQNVAYPLKARKLIKDRKALLERVQSILDLVGCASEGSRYPSQLSGGQQQRVSLARALVGNPAVLLF